MTYSDSSHFLNERIRPSDPYFNYCYWPYESPTLGVGKLRASSLLFRAIQDMPEAQWLTDCIRSIQAGIGDFRTVYGIKQVNGKWSLEMYLYDYGREDRVISVQRLMAACQEQLQLPKTVSPDLPYFMFSFDLDEDVAKANGKIDTVHVYVGNPGSTVSSGISYGFTDDPHASELENFYFFFDAKDRQQIEDKIQCAAWRNQPNTLVEEILRPDLMDCHTICLANKRTSNTIYFSGVTVVQLRSFLNWQNYPSEFQAFIAEHQSELDHLLYDVGVDYQVRGNTIEFVKSGIYGIV
ncbi:MAG: hypothetical protein ABJZ55_06165 [Fuerstiella sp.]